MAVCWPPCFRRLPKINNPQHRAIPCIGLVLSHGTSQTTHEWLGRPAVAMGTAGPQSYPKSGMTSSANRSIVSWFVATRGSDMMK